MVLLEELTSGELELLWLTSVMLSLRPDLVDVRSADDQLKDEVLGATAQMGREHLERFASSIVQAVRDTSSGTAGSDPGRTRP